MAVTQWFAPLEVSSACLADPERLPPRFAAERDEIERAWLADPPQPTEAFAKADHLLERWSQDVWATKAGDTRPIWVQRYRNVRNRRAAMRPGPVAL